MSTTFTHCGGNWWNTCARCGFSPTDAAKAETAEERRVRRLVADIQRRLDGDCDDHGACGTDCSCDACLAEAYDEAATAQRAWRPGH